MSKQVLKNNTTLTFTANASGEKQDVLIPDPEQWNINEINIANKDADLTIEDLLIDGISLGVTTFPVDVKSIFGSLAPGLVKVTIQASEGAGATAEVDVITIGIKENT